MYMCLGKVTWEKTAAGKPGKEHFSEAKPCWNLDLWLSSLQKFEKINFFCLSHPVYGILLRQAEQTDTLPLLQTATPETPLICRFTAAYWVSWLSFITTEVALLHQIIYSSIPTSSIVQISTAHSVHVLTTTMNCYIQKGNYKSWGLTLVI